MKVKKILKLKNKEIIYVSIIFLLSVIYCFNMLPADKVMRNIHHINDMTFVGNNFKENILNHNTLHFWTPYYYSGRPLYAQPEYFFLDLNALYIFFFKDVYLAMKLTTISYLFIAGIGMYFLFLSFIKNKEAALIASILFMFNGFMHTFVIYANLMILESYALIPFIFLFFSKALKDSNWIKNAILAALFLALQIFSGGVIFAPYTIILLGFYGLFYLIGKNFKSRLKKLFLVILIFSIVGLSLSAIKLLPGIEFLELSNRSRGVSYQEYLGHPIEASNMPKVLLSNLLLKDKASLSAAIGFLGFALLLFNLKQIRKRRVLFFIFVALFFLIVSMKTPLAGFLYHLPFFSKLRHIERALVMVGLSLPILAGFGYIIFSKKIENSKNTARYKKIIFIAIIALILVEGVAIQRMPKGTDIIQPEDIPLVKYINDAEPDKTSFRVFNDVLNDLVGASGYNYFSQLGISTVKGGSGIWFNDYLQYLAIAKQYNPSKLLGILNTKYVISRNKLDNQSYKFIKEFETCKNCDVSELWGPYLHENKNFVPRVYVVQDAVLVLGEHETTKNLAYNILLNENYNPRNKIIITGEKLGDYNIEELKRFKAIILLKGSIDQNSQFVLENYVSEGGIVLPNIIEGKNTMSQQDIDDLLNMPGDNYEKADYSFYSPNKVVVDTKGKEGFLVLSERFASFTGWEARTDEQEVKLLKTNQVISSIYIDEKINNITLEYKPKAFKKGLWISTITLITLILFFILRKTPLNANKKSKAKEPIK